MVEFVQKPSNRNFKDLDGQQFNKLKVIGYAGKKIHDKSSSHCWWCECQCDKKTIIKVARNHLLSCDTISCGDCNLDRKFRFTTFHEFYQEFSDKLTSNSSYLADIVFVEKPSTRKFIDKQGQRFGSVLVIGFAGMLGDAAKHGYWFCLCDCGNIAKIISSRLTTTQTGDISCGCSGHKHRTKHNKCYSKEYRSYQYAKTRCTNPNAAYYKYYGGRGIKFLFSSFEEFYTELGDKPEPKDLYSLDRIDSNGHYEKGNVRWATDSEQGKNKRNSVHITFNGKSQALTTWSIELKIPYGTLYGRLYAYKWCLECVFSVSPDVNRVKQTGCIHKTVKSK